jgi:membrane-associated phospholipid phosphatase
VWPGGWWPDLALVAGFVAVSVALASPAVRRVDLAVRDAADTHRPALAHRIAGGLNYLGSGGTLTVIALVVALVLAWRRRTPWPVAPVLAAFLLTGVVIQPLKLFFHRAAPHSPLPDQVEVRLFSQDGGLSYPSGHAVNIIVWYGVLVLLLAPALSPGLRRWARIVPVVVVGVTATYLGYHWLTDMVAGLFLGLLIDRAIARTPWPGPPAATPDAR